MSFGRDSDPRFGSFVLRGDCPTCAGSLPVNGAVESVVCGACGESVSVPGRILRDLLDDFEAGWPRPPSAGMARVGAVQWRWTSRPLRAPVCPGCGEDVRVEGLAEGSVPCACGATLHVEPVPGPLQVDVPSAQWLFRLEEAPVAEGAPVAMGCPQCGANVILPGADERLARCGHCDAQVTVPEALWRALHPIRAAHPWTVRFEGPSRRTVEAQAADAARAEAEAADQARRVVEEAERARAVEAARVAAEAERVSAEAARAAEVTRLAAEAIRTRRIVVVGVVFCLLCVAFFVAVKG